MKQTLKFFFFYLGNKNPLSVYLNLLYSQNRIILHDQIARHLKLALKHFKINITHLLSKIRVYN
jgi:hypothetical protein